MSTTGGQTIVFANIDFANIDFAHLFLFFLSYAFLGWICEEIWCTVKSRKITKRGMLHGPICPIYGFGSVLILYLLEPWRTTWVRLFFASMIVTSILEYFTSWLLEKLFHAKWWDYSKEKFNLNGRVCLLNSAAFGVGGLALEHLIHPLVEKLIYWKTASPYINYIAAGLLSVILLDLLVTVHKLVDFAATMEKVKAYAANLKERYEGEEWFKPESFRTMIESIKEKAALEKSRFTQKSLETLESYAKKQKIVEFWLKRFPIMITKEENNVFEHMKSVVLESWKKKSGK